MPDRTVRLIPAEATRSLRHRILRPHQPEAACVYDGDLGPKAVHVGAFVEDRLVGVATFLPQPPPHALAEADVPAQADASSTWRLRGMAVEAAHRRAGHGRALLEAGLRHVTDRGGALLWFNARTPAAPFYEALGFERRSEVFEMPPIGPHVVMSRSLHGDG